MDSIPAPPARTFLTMPNEVGSSGATVALPATVGQARVYCCVQTHTLGPQNPGVGGFKSVMVAGGPEVAV
jgi:hypothetical protein